MSVATNPSSEATRAEARRTQIRTAAENCFRQHGFPGTSNAPISRAEEHNPAPGPAGLQLEICAEAARKPGVADIVRAADRQCRASLAATLRTQRPAAGHQDSESTLPGMTEALAAMVEGLQI